jgi:hypothetical protein
VCARARVGVAVRLQVAELLEARLLQAGRLPVALLSGLMAQGTQQLLGTLLDAHDKWNTR